MEVALSTRFLASTTLFSLIYDNYEKDLKHEFFLCHKNMEISMTEIEMMPILDRKYYIHLHNKSVEEMKQKMQSQKHG